MIEIKLVATKSAGVPVIAIVLGAIITAEPAASRGIWCGGQGVQDIFAICNHADIDTVKDTIQLMNQRSVYMRRLDKLSISEKQRVEHANKTVDRRRESIPIDVQILHYMQWFPELKHQQIIKSIKS